MTTALLVDDSKFMVRAMKQIVESFDIDVVATAGDGNEGLEAYRAHQPDVTLLDVTMPNMDGLQCLQAIRSEYPDAKIIMVSAIRTEETVQRCLDSGAVAFLQKPIRPNSPSDLARLSDALDAAKNQTNTAHQPETV
ncbi:MAG: response regulator [Planctomycetota bacterium]